MIEVGQKVWVVHSKHPIRDNGEIKERTVETVGRKYFTLQGDHRGTKYNLDTLQMVSDYGSATRVYTSLTEILDKRERESLEVKIRQAFSSYGATKFTLDQLREVALTLELQSDK
jgi:hypothetical protein